MFEYVCMQRGSGVSVQTVDIQMMDGAHVRPSWFQKKLLVVILFW